MAEEGLHINGLELGTVCLDAKTFLPHNNAEIVEHLTYIDYGHCRGGTLFSL